MEDIQRAFNKILKEINLPTPISPSRKKDFVGSKQQKEIDTMKNLLENNLTGSITTWGGSFEEDQFKQAKEKLPAVIKELQLEAKEKEIKAYFDSYSKVMKKFLDKHVVAHAPVKTMPFKNVYMHTVPKIDMSSKGTLEINDSPIGYIVELPYQVERGVVYGEMQGQKPLFAPIIGSLELNWKTPDQKPAPGEKEYIEDFELQSRFFQVMDKQTTRNSVWRYQNYGRKGEPICDRLLANEDLMVSMERVISEVDSKEFKANASACGIVHPIDGRSIVAIVDFDGVHKNAFEAIFKLCAYLDDVPHVPAAGAGTMAGAPAGGGGYAPQPSLPTWSEEELANRPNKFAGGPKLPAWTEEELAKREDKFTGGPNLPVWTEDELEEMAKKSGPSLNLPEWKEDEDMIECPKCGYACQADWGECPVCNTKLEKKAQKPAAQKPAAQKPAAQKPTAQKPPATQRPKPEDKKPDG